MLNLQHVCVFYEHQKNTPWEHLGGFKSWITQYLLRLTNALTGSAKSPPYPYIFMWTKDNLLLYFVLKVSKLEILLHGKIQEKVSVSVYLSVSRCHRKYHSLSWCHPWGWKISPGVRGWWFGLGWEVTLYVTEVFKECFQGEISP